MPRYLILLALFLLAGCTSQPTREVAQQQGLRSEDPLLTLPHGGRERLYRLHLPGLPPKSAGYPLVVMLHGAMGNGELFSRRTRFNDIADREGFIVAWPYGSGWMPERMLTWNAGYCCFTARDEQVDDVGFIVLLLQRLTTEYPVDTQRIYLAGFSNGGMMALRMAGVMGSQLAAVASVSGTIGGREASGMPFIGLPGSGPLPPVVLIHGVADEQVPYLGGRARKTIGTRLDASVDEAIETYRQRNRCKQPPHRQSLADGRIERQDLVCAQGGLRLLRLNFGGHAWPGGEQLAGWGLEDMAIRVLLDPPSHDLDASEEIWRFFRYRQAPASGTLQARVGSR